MHKLNCFANSIFSLTSSRFVFQQGRDVPSQAPRQPGGEEGDVPSQAPKQSGEAACPLTPQEKEDTVFGKKGPLETKSKEVPKLNPKLKERVESAIRSMYDLIGERETKGPFRRLDKYEVERQHDGSSRGISFSKEKITLRFWFETSGQARMIFDGEEVAYYGPNKYSNVKLLAKKMEEFLRKLRKKKSEGKFKEVEDF